MILFHIFFLLCDHLTEIYDPLLFYFFYMTNRPKNRVLIDLFLLFAHDYLTKMYDPLSFAFFLLCKTIPLKATGLIDLFCLFSLEHSTKLYDPLSVILSLCTTIRPKIRVAIILFFFIHDHSTKFRCYSYSLIYSFLNCHNISFAIFMAVLPLYFFRSFSGNAVLIFIGYNHSCTTLIFRIL